MNADADADADTMIGTIEFLKCAGSPATAEFPLIADDSELDDYVVTKYDNVKFVEDIQQTIVMPSFDGWSECNMVRFESYAVTNPWVAYYWITDAVRSSNSLNATEFALEFNPVTTLMKKGATVEGNWLRSPTNYTPWKQQAVISGTMGYTDKAYEFNNMPTDDLYAQYDVYWVSITATKDADGTQGSLEIYGFPVMVNPANPATDVDKQVCCKDNGAYYYFPSLSDILNGNVATIAGLTAEEITDISITRHAPFNCAFGYDGDVSYFILGTGISPIQIGTATTRVYHITGTTAMPIREVTYSMVLSEFEMACGQVGIRDTNGSIVATIPTNWFSRFGDSYVLNYRVQTVVDYSQIYDRVIIQETTASNTPQIYGVFQIPASHIPYIGSAWDSYRAYSMSYDREAMEFGIDQSNRQMQAALVSQGIGLAASIATGNVGGIISSGASMATTYKNAKLSEEATRFNQSLSERRVQAQPTNGYNVNYGLSYFWNEGKMPVCITISLPVGATEAIFNDFIKDFGYSNEGTYTMTITYGFYQGTVYSKPTLTGPRYMELINAFNKGVRLINPSGVRT